MNTPNIDKLSSLERRAAQLTAQGVNDVTIKDQLVLSLSTWEQYRANPVWNAAVQELKAQQGSETKDFDEAIDAMAS